MRITVIAVGTGLAGYLLQLFLPWWSIAVAAFVVSFLFARKGVHASAGSFLGGLLLWIVWAAVIDTGNASILSDRVADIFFVQEPMLLIGVTGVIGGIAAVLPGLSGFYMRSLLGRSRRASSKYQV